MIQTLKTQLFKASNKNVDTGFALCKPKCGEVCAFFSFKVLLVDIVTSRI